jgi:pyridoxal phosphate enzyme (YggS family)
MLIGPQNLAVNVTEIRSRIEASARAAGRDPATVNLIAVSKSQPAESVRVAATLGVTDFGENYVQEGLAKIAALGEPGLNWHFIGRIQTNKTRDIAQHFSWVHSVDRLAVAQRLSQQRPFHAPPLNLCLQVALVPEPAKGGLPPAALAETAARVADLPRVRLRGLMCVPPFEPDAGAQLAVFSRLAALLAELREDGLALDTLSMGMSADFESAIAAGATQVRIGTALFGERNGGPGR